MPTPKTGGFRAIDGATAGEMNEVEAQRTNNNDVLIGLEKKRQKEGHPK